MQTLLILSRLLTNDDMKILRLAQIWWIRDSHEGQLQGLGRVTFTSHFCRLLWGLLSQAGGNGPLNERNSKVADDIQQKFLITASSSFLAHVVDWVFSEAQEAWAEQKFEPTVLMVYWKHFHVLEMYPNRNSNHF